MGSCNRCEGRVCAEEGKGVPIVKEGKRGGKRIHERAVKEGIYPAVQVITNGTGVFCREEGWKEEDGTELLVS